MPASSYYAWRKRGKSKRELENEMILKEIKTIHSDKKKEIPVSQTSNIGKISYSLLYYLVCFLP